MKLSGGGSGYTRREIECHPKAIKATAVAKAASSAVAKDASPADTIEAGEKEHPKPPPRSRAVDEGIVREILSGPVAERASSDNSITARGDENSSVENMGEDSSSDREEVGSSVEAGAGEGEEEAPTSSTPGSAEIWDADLFDDLADGAENEEEAIEWEKYQARRQDDRRKQEEAKERIRLKDKRGGSGRKSRRAWDNDDRVRKAWSADSDGGEETRRRRTAAGRGGRGGGRGREGGGRGAGAGASAGTARHEGGFAGRGRMSPSMQAGFGRGRGGRGSGNGNRWQGAEGPGRGTGRGNGGTSWTSPPVAPVRPTPKYKWRTSNADGNGASAGAGAPIQQPQQQMQNRDVMASTTARALPQDGGSRSTRADDAGGEIRGFRARFGGGATGSGQQQPTPRRPTEFDPADSTAATEVIPSGSSENGTGRGGG